MTDPWKLTARILSRSAWIAWTVILPSLGAAWIVGWLS